MHIHTYIQLSGAFVRHLYKPTNACMPRREGRRASLPETALLPACGAGGSRSSSAAAAPSGWKDNRGEKRRFRNRMHSSTVDNHYDHCDYFSKNSATRTGGRGGGEADRGDGLLLVGRSVIQVLFLCSLGLNLNFCGCVPILVRDAL